MRLEIITPDKEIFKGETTLVQLPGLDGLFEILNNHAPLISALRKGNVKIMDENNEPKFFEINGGVVEVVNNKILVLAE
ncbi:MAG: ATP synthase F1 subunit epsilon [Bacteroidales bacterium]|nr:ATP synthase F1 subunit epsilon [Bacteroidales bacterium]